MNDHGYTLAEMLVALVMIGLAVGGLTQGARLLGLMQKSTTGAVEQAQTLRLAYESLNRLVESQGPFSSKDAASASFIGSPTRFSFDCGGRSRCGASLGFDARGASLGLSGRDGQDTTIPLEGVVRANFLYGGDQGASAVWPPATDKPQSLKWIALVRATAAGSAPLMSVRLWIDEVPNCQFDTITRACRSAGG